MNQPSPQPADEARLLPDRQDWPQEPDAVVLRLRTTRSREGSLDGAWWPRSRNLTEQLPGLVEALTPHIGRVDRVGVDTTAWDDTPDRMVIGAHVVHIDQYPVGEDNIILTRGPHDHFLLLVIPPSADAASAHAAMTTAVLAGGTASAQQILVKTGVTHSG